MIDIDSITLQVGGKVLLSEASAHISDAQRVGLVGENGCGKTTLLRALQGQLDVRSGTIRFPLKQRISYVAQENNEIQTPLLDYMLSQDTERCNLLNRLEKADPMEMAQIHERLLAIDADTAPARACQILSGLGFTDDDFQRPISVFSGGWRMRLFLAVALFKPSEILLLDEPTNHLDLEASVWLESHLSKYAGTLLIISHDRFILNNVCTHILHIENQRLFSYTGNYDTFQKTRLLKREQQAKQAIRQEAYRAHLQSYVDRFRYKASKAKQAQSRLKMIEKMDMVEMPSAESSSVFSFPQPDHIQSPFLNVESAAVGYDEHAVLKNLNFRICENDRIALLGKNGNGKSTLAKLICHRLKPLEGTVFRSSKLEIGYFAQHQAEELPLAQTPVFYMSNLMQEANETKVRAHLAAFGLSGDKATTMIKSLSGGEKARLLFATMTIHHPSLLILDEPTNHLDIQGREALTDALNNYTGAIILITHDLHLIELVCDTLWQVSGGTLTPFDGDLDDYRKVLLAKDKKEKKTTDTTAKLSYLEQKQQTSLLRQTKSKLQKKIDFLDKSLENLNIQKEKLSKKFMEDMTSSQIVALQKELAMIENQIQIQENEWLDLSDKLEKL